MNPEGPYNEQHLRSHVEARLMSVSGVASATFYDGDGNRIKATLGGVTTYYVGNHFEWTGSTSTMIKYYYAGGQRVAMRQGSSTLYFLFSSFILGGVCDSDGPATAPATIGNPLRYTDPTGHFSPEQLAKWLGENWRDLFNEAWPHLLEGADFGGAVAYGCADPDLHGRTIPPPPAPKTTRWCTSVPRRAAAP
jgi:hypothetical protein